MHVEKAEKSQVRKILIAMIVDSVVLGRIATKWTKKGLFRDDWVNLIGEWCVDYYNRYDEAPKKDIEGSFEEWAEEQEDQTVVKLVEKFLSQVSGQYKRLQKRINSQYMIDKALKYFNRVQVEKHIDSLQGSLDKGKVDKAFKSAAGFAKLELGPQRMVNVLEDRDIVRDVFKEKVNPLIKYRGALGNFFESCFQRDALVGFMGPEKRGKTWWLIDAAWRAMLQQRRVAFFEVGDMSQNQIMRRLMVRASGRPFKPQTVKVPLSIEAPEKFRIGKRVIPPDVEFEKQRYKTWLDKVEAWDACKRVVRRSGEDLLKLGVWYNTEINATGIQAELKLLERQSWVPDVVCIDYADILGTLPGYANDSQDQIDMTWRILRGISQEYHCCVITATQSKAESYYVETLDKSHFSRDKRKFAHVTAMIGINQTRDEKRLGVYRLNDLAVRESDYDEEKCVWIAGCLALANPAMRSTF